MKKINQQFGVPFYEVKERSGTRSDYPMKRQFWLDGKDSSNRPMQCYYAPGQLPNCCPELGLSDGTSEASEIILPYTPPTDWPKKGSVLRQIKQVYLSQVWPTLLNTNLSTIGGSASNPWHPIVTFTGLGWCGFPRTAITYSYSSGSDTLRIGNDWTGSIPNFYIPEYLRLDAIFRQIKTNMEQDYPNELYITAPQWQYPAWYPNPNTTLLGSLENFRVANRWFHLTCPPQISEDTGQETQFFGTNFLHIYCGKCGVDYNFFDFGFIRAIDQNFGDISTDTVHQENVQRIILNAKKFSGFNIKLFDYHLDFPLIPQPTITWNGPEVLTVDVPDPATYDACTLPEWLAPNHVNSTDYADWLAQYNSLVTYTQNLVNGTNNRYLLEMADNTAVMQQSASILNNSVSSDNKYFSIELTGSTSNITYDYLYDLIRRHYNLGKARKS